MIAWVCPGQGAAQRLRAEDLVPGDHRGELLDEVRALTGHPLAGSAGVRALRDTALAQPALTALTLGAARALREAGHRPDLVAGHSAGEVAAWCLAGGCSYTEALRLSVQRGRAMGAARPEGWGMWASPVPLESPPNEVVLAVENPGQWVYSGPMARLRALEGRAVPTSGPWHHPTMSRARAGFATAMAAIPARTLVCDVVSNHDGCVVREDARVREHLLRQLTHPARWTRCLAVLRQCEAVVVLGPGRLLRHHLREVGVADVISVRTAADIARLPPRHE